MYLIHICWWKHIWTRQLWKFPPTAGKSVRYHINHEFSRNWMTVGSIFLFYSYCLQWFIFVQHFLPFIRKFLQQAMFKFYHFNNIQPPVQRKCRKITSQNQWKSLCRGSQWCLEGVLRKEKEPGSEANRNKRNVWSETRARGWQGCVWWTICPQKTFTTVGT